MSAKQTEDYYHAMHSIFLAGWLRHTKPKTDATHMTGEKML